MTPLKVWLSKASVTVFKKKKKEKGKKRQFQWCDRKCVFILHHSSSLYYFVWCLTVHSLSCLFSALGEETKILLFLLCFYSTYQCKHSYSHFTGGTGTPDCTDVTATLRMCSDVATLFSFLRLCSRTEAKNLSRFQLLSVHPSALLLLLSLLFLDSCSRKCRGFSENEDGIVSRTVGFDLNTANSCTIPQLLQSWQYVLNKCQLLEPKQ